MADAATTRRTAIVFDFDGTLFDASGAILHSFENALKDLDRPPMSRKTVSSLIGRPLFEMYRNLYPDTSEEETQRFIDRYRAHFWPVSLSLSKKMPGLDDCLRDLHPGRRFAIATNRSARGARYILEGFNLAFYFPVIVGLEDVKQVKPHPEAVLKAIDQLGGHPSGGAMVGDTVEDVQAARAAGVLAIGVTTGTASREDLEKAGADAVIASLADLPELV